MSDRETLRERGWSVAVHNDYRLSGGSYTFWLMTHPCGRWIKGEGATDEVALAQCLEQADEVEATDAIAAHEASVAARTTHDTIIEKAAKALRIWTGHDSGPNIRHHYGERWWEPLKAIESDLLTLLKDHQP